MGDSALGQTVNRAKQGFPIYWLREIRTDTALLRLLTIRLLRLDRENNDRDVLCAGVLPDPLAQVEAFVNARRRHHNVEYHQIGKARLEVHPHFRAIAGLLHFVSFLLQEILNAKQYVGLIVCNQYLGQMLSPSLPSHLSNSLAGSQ